MLHGLKVLFFVLIFQCLLNSKEYSLTNKNAEEQKEIALKHLQIRQEILLFGCERLAELTSEIEPVDLSVSDKFNKYCD